MSNAGFKGTRLTYQCLPTLGTPHLKAVNIEKSLVRGSNGRPVLLQVHTGVEINLKWDWGGLGRRRRREKV